MSNDFDRLRRRLLEQLSDLCTRQALEREPIIRALAHLQALEPPQPVIIDVDRLSPEQRAALIERLKP